MDIDIHIGKRQLLFLVALVCILFIAGVSATYEVSHAASDIGPGVFGAPGESGDYGFPGNLSVGNAILLPGSVGANGIFWGSVRSVFVPHIDYSPSTGLWVSAGAGSSSPVNFENDVVLNGANLDASSGVVSANDFVAGNSITLGGIKRTRWSGVTDILYWTVPDFSASSYSFQRIINPAQDGYAFIIAKGTIASYGTFYIRIDDVIKDKTSLTVSQGEGHTQAFSAMYLQPVTEGVSFKLNISGYHYDTKLAVLFIS